MRREDLLHTGAQRLDTSYLGFKIAYASLLNTKNNLVMRPWLQCAGRYIEVFSSDEVSKILQQITFVIFAFAKEKIPYTVYNGRDSASK